jgi:transmembrane 9 superfamily member 2/4
MRTLNKDIAMYNDDEDFTENTTGWKILHGGLKKLSNLQDVFRAPPLPALFSIICGTGVQLCGMALITVIFASIGFLSPSNRGEIFIILISCFALMGIFAGYFSLRLYKMFGGEYWKTVTFFTGIFFPGFIFLLFAQINVTIWVLTSAPLLLLIVTFLKLLGIWLGISFPLGLSVAVLNSSFNWRFNWMEKRRIQITYKSQ